MSYHIIFWLVMHASGSDLSKTFSATWTYIFGLLSSRCTQPDTVGIWRHSLMRQPKSSLLGRAGPIYVSKWMF